MELRVLKYFLMAAREENITKAAQLLHITQPTLSRQLMQLEEELGVKLFRRGKYNVSLTEEGMLLKRRAQEIISLSDKTIQEFSHKEETISGEIAIGCGETRSMSLLSDYLVAFQAEHPLVQFHIYSANADDIKEKIAKGLLDMGLLTEPVELGRYEYLRMLIKERWGILVRRDSELAKKDKIIPEDLLEQSLIMVKRELVKNELANWFGDYYDQLHVTASYNLLTNVATMVRRGVGIAICVDLGAVYEDLCFIPLEPVLENGSVIVWKKNQMLPDSAYHFIKYIKMLNRQTL